MEMKMHWACSMGHPVEANSEEELVRKAQEHMQKEHGLTAAQAAWHSGPERHSIWQMVHHLSHYCRLMLLRLDGAPIPENWREGEWGPREDPPGEGAWAGGARPVPGGEGA